ncbi:MAG: FecR family protein [Ilyomonas sp.]
MITKELFDKFLQNECTEEERLLVLNFLHENPAALDEFLPAEEFEYVVTGELPPELEIRLLDEINKKTRTGITVPIIAKRILAAASVILIAGFAWKFFMQHDVADKSVPAVANFVNVPKWVNVSAANKAVDVLLPDSSLIKLSAHSSLKYKDAFGKNKTRQIYLSGRAFFKVAKDKTKPFTVFSGEIATTVLGTTFTVTAYEERKLIRVHLHTGLVTINSSEEQGKTLDSSIFLRPGDEFFYNRLTKSSNVRRANKTKTNEAKKKNEKHNIYKPNWYQFKGQELSDVFDQLSFYYQVDIEYAKEDIKNHYITAQFTLTDSLDKILKDIALLNDLKVSKQQNKYIISK